MKTPFPSTQGPIDETHQLRIQAVIPLSGDAMARAKDVAAFEPTLDAFTEAVARAGGQIAVDVVKAKPRPAKYAQ